MIPYDHIINVYMGPCRNKFECEGIYEKRVNLKKVLNNFMIRIIHAYYVSKDSKPELLMNSHREDICPQARSHSFFPVHL